MKQIRCFLFIMLVSVFYLGVTIQVSAEGFKALKERGRFFIEKQWYEDAEKDLEKAISEYPEQAKIDDEVHFYLALLHYNRTNIKEAMSELRIALKINSKEKYVELQRTILAEFGQLIINAAEKISGVNLRMQTNERFISPRKKVVFNRWENRLQNETFDLPLSQAYLPIGEYNIMFQIPGRDAPITKTINIESDGADTKIYLLLIEPPVNLQAEGQDKLISLSWEKLGQGTYTGFEIYRMDKPDSGNFTKVGDTKETKFIDADLKIGKNYSYKVRAFDPRAEKTAFSATVSASTYSLNPPSEIVALGEDRQVNLYWVTSGGSKVTGYLVYRSGTRDKEFRLVAELGLETSYTDYDMDKGETYIYKIKSFNSVGANSPYSEKVTARTMGISAPQKFRIRPESDGINLLWKKVPPAKFFNLYRGEKKMGKYEMIAQISGRDTQYLDTMENPEDALRYWYKITCVDKQGKETRPSKPISLSEPQVDEEERDEREREYTKSQEKEWEDIDVDSAPQDDNQYKVYFSKDPDENFIETKATTLISLISGLKPRQRIYYKIISFDDGGNPDASFNFSLKVSRVNQPPTSVTGGDRQVIVNQPFLLDGSGSSDPENDKLIYKWVQRLDNPDAPQSLLLSLEPKVEMKLRVPGEYVFYLEISDGELNNIQTVIIEVLGD